MSGYNQQTDGSFGIWWTKWMVVGFLLAIGFCVYLCHLANVRVEEEQRIRDHQSNEKYEAESPSTH